jgi:hypothetical protein
MEITMSIIIRICAVITVLAAVMVVVCHKKSRQSSRVWWKKIQQAFDRDFSKSFGSQLKWLSLAVLSVFLMLAAGSWLFHPLSEGFGERLWSLTGHFLNPGGFDREGDGNSNLWVLVTGLAGMIFLSGLLISVFNNILERRVENVKNGRVYYSFRHHIVIIGYNRMSVALIKQLAEKYPQSEIVLQTVQPVPEVRHDLFSKLNARVEQKVVIVCGNRTSVEDLQKLHLNRCLEVFILGENEEYDNDSLNIECLKKIHALLRPRASLLRCNVLFEYQSTFAVFQQQDIDEIRERIDFVPFNYHETWAQKVFVNLKYEIQERNNTIPDTQTAEQNTCIEYTPLDHQPITPESDRKVHLVIIGMSNMGVALGIQAAHLCHFPNFETRGIKTRITFIDEQADREMNFLKGRYKHLFREVDCFYRDIEEASRNFDNTAEKEKFTDIEFEFVKGSVEHPGIRDYLAGACTEADVYLTIAVCFSFPPQAIAAGLYLPDEVYDNRIPVIIRQEISYCTVAMLSSRLKEGGYRKYANVKPFGMLDNCYDPEKAGDLLPMMVNYVYVTRRMDFPVEQMKAEWDKLGTAYKWSNRYNADAITLKARSFGIGKPTSDEPEVQLELMAKVEHNRWNMEKLLMGFRPTSAAEKEAIGKDSRLFKAYKAKFVHSCICAYGELDDAMQENDRYISKALPFMLREYERLKKQSINKE